MKTFKIKNEQGLYSTGGIRPSWDKRGKFWTDMRSVNLHLSQITDRFTRMPEIYKNASIVNDEDDEVIPIYNSIANKVDTNAFMKKNILKEGIDFDMINNIAVLSNGKKLELESRPIPARNKVYYYYNEERLVPVIYEGCNGSRHTLIMLTENLQCRWTVSVPEPLVLFEPHKKFKVTVIYSVSTGR